MSGTFDAQLEEAFRTAAVDRDQTSAFKDLAKQHPEAAAEAVSKNIPLFMEQERARASEAFGVEAGVGQRSTCCQPNQKVG